MGVRNKLYLFNWGNSLAWTDWELAIFVLDIDVVPVEVVFLTSNASLDFIDDISCLFLDDFVGVHVDEELLLVFVIAVLTWLGVFDDFNNVEDGCILGVSAAVWTEGCAEVAGLVLDSFELGDCLECCEGVECV